MAVICTNCGNPCAWMSTAGCSVCSVAPTIVTPHAAACVAAIAEHCGGRPEMVGKFVRVLQEYAARQHSLAMNVLAELEQEPPR